MINWIGQEIEPGLRVTRTDQQPTRARIGTVIKIDDDKSKVRVEWEVSAGSFYMPQPHLAKPGQRAPYLMFHDVVCKAHENVSWLDKDTITVIPESDYWMAKARFRAWQHIKTHADHFCHFTKDEVLATVERLAAVPVSRPL